MGASAPPASIATAAPRREERAHALRPALDDRARLALEDREPAAAAGDHRADVLRLRGHVERGVVDRLARRGHGELRVGVHAPRRAPVHHVLGIEVLDLARDAGLDA